MSITTNSTSGPSLPAGPSTTSGTIHMDDTYGALLLGTFFSLVLYGLVLHQTYRYIRLHPHDYTYIQVLVALSLILETLHTVSTMHVGYHALVTNYFDPTALTQHVWSLNLFMLAGVLRSSTLHQYGTSGSPSILGSRAEYRPIQLPGVSNTSLSQPCSFVIRGYSDSHTTTRDFWRPRFRSADPATFITVVLIHQQSYLIHGKFAAAAAAHLVLTGSLIYALHRGQRIRKERKNAMEWCMLYIINTGSSMLSCSPFSVFDIIAWILAFAVPGTACLNSRQLLTRAGIEIFGTDSTTERNFIARAQRLATAERYNVPQLPDRAPTRIDIKVATEIEEGDGDAQSRTSRSSVIIEGGKVAGM
ncbi:hypothetical protein V8D89_001644 [Ganoderma adspersum]